MAQPSGLSHALPPRPATYHSIHTSNQLRISSSYATPNILETTFHPDSQYHYLYYFRLCPSDLPSPVLIPVACFHHLYYFRLLSKWTVFRADVTSVQNGHVILGVLKHSVTNDSRTVTGTGTTSTVLQKMNKMAAKKIYSNNIIITR